MAIIFILVNSFDFGDFGLTVFFLWILKPYISDEISFKANANF